MAKSKGRLLAELLASDGKVKESKSALEIQGGKIKAAELPTITNSQLENSSITIAGEQTALGGSVSLNTGHITEHTNYKYYTDARVRSAISASGDLSYNSSTGVISFSATGSPVVSVNSQTGSVVLDTGDLAEDGNLFFTNARARGAISVSGNAISYNSSTGVITANYEESPAFGGTVSINQGASFSVLQIGTGRTGASENIGGINFVNSSSTLKAQVYGSNDGKLRLTTNGSTIALTLDASQNATFVGNTYAPIYYDSDNTGRYFNGNGTSVIQNLQTVGEIYATNGMKTLNSAGNGWNNTINRNGGSPIGNFPGGINLTSGTITTSGNITSGSVTAGDSSTSKFLRAHYSDGSYMTLEGYGLVMNRAVSYIRPSSDGNKSLYVGGADDTLDWANIYFRSLNGLYITGNKFIDANRQFIANSKITFDYNDHYLEAGTGTITLKNDSDASLVTLGQASQFNGTVKINSHVSGVGDINLGTAISGHSSSDPARITATTQGQLYLDSTNGQNIYLGWWNSSGADIISEMNFRGPSFKDRNDTAYFLNPAGASTIRNLEIKGTTSDSSTDALHIRNAAGATQSYFRNDGTVVIGGSQYLYVTASGGAYFSNSIKARGGINNDQGDLLLNDTVQVAGPVVIQGSGSQERYLAFTLDGKNSAFSGSNNAFIFNGQGSTGDYLAGALYFQSRSNSVSREIGFITGTSPAKRLVVNDSGITVTGTISGNLTGTVTGTATQASNLNNHSTTNLSEGTNLYYTDARVGSYLSNNGYATQSTIVAAITDSAPSTLDTLNELAAALGDDANFSTTVTNSIATKAPLASPALTGNPSISGNLMMTNSTSHIELGSYLKLYAATASNTGTIAINANYGGAQTDNWTPDYSGDSNAGMWLLRQASGGSGIMQVLQKKHGTTGGSHARSSFTKTAEFHHDGHFYGRNLRSERYYSSDNTAYYTDPSETSVINKLLVNGANNNSGKADFAVSAGGSHSQVSLHGNQIQAGGTDMNYNVKLAYDGDTRLIGWNNNIYIGTSGGSSATAKNIYFQPQAAGGTSTNRLTIHGDNGAVIADTQMRAPIFYDSDNTAYYSDPHGLSKMSQASIGTTSGPSSGYALRMGGAIQMDGNNIHYANQVHFNNGTRFQTNSDSVLNFYGNNTSAVQLNFGTGAAERNGAIYATSSNDMGFLDSDNNWAYRLRTDNDHNWYINNIVKLRLHADTSASYFSAPGEFRFRPNGSTSNWAHINTDYLSHQSDIRAPIFYDSQNTSYYIDPASTSFVNQFSANKLLVDNNLVLDMPNNSTERGPWNPIVTSIRNSGHKLHIDEDFQLGTNSVGVYNNSGGNAVTITHVTATSDPGLNAPNSSGKLLKIAYLSSNSAGVSPGYGGFVQNIPAEDNHTFVQIFQAKLPSGRSLVIAENSQGSNNTSYWLTNNVGTGKFEWYARVSHCGDSGTFSSGGHVYVSGGSNADFNWYLASATVIDVTESHRLYGKEMFADAQMKAPVYYDSNNTAYFIDPDNTSHSAKFRQHVSIGDGSDLTNNGGWGARLKLEDGVHSKIDVNQNANSMNSHWYAHTGQDSIKFGTSSAHDVEIQRGGTTRIEATDGGATITGIGQATSDFRAPIFYDRDNTDFYLNPVGSSKLYGTLYLGHTNTQPGTLVIYDTGNNGMEIKGTGSNNFQFDMIGTGSTGSILFNDFSGRFTHNLTINNNLYIGDGDDGYFYNDTNGRTAFANGDFYFQNTVTNFYNYATNQYYGDSSGDNIHFRGNVLDGTSWTINPGDFRAPIFYDSNNTGYYLNPNGLSNITELRIDGTTNNGSYDATLLVTADNNNDWAIIVAKAQSSATEYGLDLRLGSSHTYAWRGLKGGTQYARMGTDLLYHDTRIDAPIFYDHNNTAYYLDASSTGTSLKVAGNAIIPGYAEINNVKMGNSYDVSLNSINNNVWLTIAEFSGARKHDIIEVWENTSSRHNYLKLDVSWSYGQGSIQVLNGVRHGNHTIQKVRLLYNTSDRTYSTGKLQVYLGNWATSYTLYTKQSAFAKQGWGRSTLKTSVEEGTPSGYTEHEDSIMNVIEDPNGSFGSTGRITAGMGIDIYNGSPIKFHTASGDGTATERGFIDAQEGGHLRIATSGGENIVFQDGGVGGTTNLTILGSGEMVKEATERFTIKSHTNSWDGGLRFYASDNSTIFQIHPDTNGQMYVDREWRFANSQINYGPIRRGAHNVGHLEGSYNNVGGNGSQSNPIYTIGSSYNPGTTTLSNMYGIGYSNQAASFISGGLTNGDWGFYVAADGDARVFIDGSTGHGNFLGNVRGTSFYDINNTTYYIDPAEATSAYLNGNVSVPSNTGLVARGDWAKITTSHGYIQIGPANTSHAHIYTDRPNFYLNKPLYILGDTLLNENDIRSAVFYDLNDTTYRMDLTSTGDSIVAKGTIHIGPDGHLGIGDITHPKIAYPGYGAAWSASGTSTGAIIIDLPGTLNNYDMMYFEVDIYEYSAQNGTKIIVGGHNWNSGGNSGTSNTMWHNVGVKIIGDMDKAVRFGWRNNGSVNKRCMIIGEGSSSWSYATVHVSKVSGATSFYNDAIDYTGDWNVVQTTDNSDFNVSPSTNFNSTGEQTLKTNGRMAAYGYQGNGNVGGTGSASWHPSGIYSNGYNWLYGTINQNNNPIINNRYIEFGAGSSHSHEMSTYNANNIRFRTSSDGASGILLQDNSGNFRAQLYGDGSNYGFLDGNWASWDLRKVVNGALYLNGDTSYYLQPEANTSANLYGDVIINQYGRGVIGLYSSTKYQHVWSMGSAYRLSTDGSGVGNLYGLSYTHTNVGTGTDQAISGLSHQLQHRHNGTLTAAIGSGIWTSGNVTAYSDIAVKRNLEVIPDALNKVCQLNGYTYERTDYVKDEEDPEAPDILRQAGVVAQEVEKVLPEVVSGPEGNKAVAYGNMVSILIEAVKELKAEVDDLKEQLKNK